MESPSLEILKTHLDAVLCSLLWVTLLRQGVGLDDPQRSLPTSNIPWFCDSVIIKHNAIILLISLTQTLQVREWPSKKFSTDNTVIGCFPERKTLVAYLSEDFNLSCKCKDCNIWYTVFFSLWCVYWWDSLRVDIKCILILWTLAAYWIIYMMSFTYYIWVWQFQI